MKKIMKKKKKIIKKIKINYKLKKFKEKNLKKIITIII